MDELYIQKVLEGDINSFRYLVDRYKDMSFSIAISLLKDEDEAKDAVQEAFVKAFSNLKSFRKRSGFSTWLYRIVVNESLGRLRKKKNEMSIDIPAEISNDDETLTQQAAQNLSRYEQRKYINKVLDMMDGRESLLLRLFYLNDNNLNEIREITGFSLSNIRVILYRARKNFHSLLNMELKEEIRSII